MEAEGGSARWVDMIPDFLENYHSSPHSGIVPPTKPKDMTPQRVTDEMLRKYKHNEALLEQLSVDEGDTVRIPVGKVKFPNTSTLNPWR